MKKLISLLLVLCLLFALAACGEKPAGDDAADDTAGGDVGTYTGSADFDWGKYKGVQFEIMWQESDDTQIDICQNYAQPALQEIEDEYGVDFTWVGNVDASYTQLAATGDLSDVWFGNVTLEMIQSDIMLDLTPYLEVDSYLKDTFTTPDFYYFNGTIWSVSTGVDSFYNGTLYYNKTLFDELGITDISTYDKLSEACAKLAEAGYKGLTFDGKPNSGWTRFLWQNVLISVDPQAYIDIIAGDKAAFQNEAIGKSFELIRDLKDAGYLGAAVNTRETADSISAFANKEYGMLYTDSWNNGTVDNGVAGAFDVGVAWWPTANADNATGAYIAGWGSPLSGWCAKADTEYPELAVEVIKAINVAEAARHLAAGLGTNHVQDGAPTPANDLEAQRFELRANVGTFLKGWTQNTSDAATTTAFQEILSTVCSEDPYDIPALVTEMDTAWQANTFFG